MVAVPAAEHVAAVVDTVGTDGVVNCAAMLNELLATDVQLPLPAVEPTSYGRELNISKNNIFL